MLQARRQAADRGLPDYEAIYVAIHDPLVAMVFSLTRDWSVAEDITQEAFERAYAQWARLEEYDRPDLWVRRVAINLATSRWRRMRREASLLSVLHRERAAVSDGEEGMVASHLDLLEALRRVPRRQAQALVLYYVADLPLSDIAGVMECAPGTVKAHLHAGRRRLAAEMGADIE